MRLEGARRRWAFFALILGLTLAAGPLVTNVPEERRLRLHLDEPREVERVDLVWLDHEQDPLQRLSLPFDAGEAPERIDRDVRLKEGRHKLLVTVWRAGVPHEAERVIDIVEDASEITVRLSSSRR